MNNSQPVEDLGTKLMRIRELAKTSPNAQPQAERKPGPPGPIPDRVARCTSCQADIIWCRTERGRRMPVDAEPVETGTIIYGGRVDGEPLARVLTANQREAIAEGAVFYVSHFATCLFADEHRKRTGTL